MKVYRKKTAETFGTFEHKETEDNYTSEENEDILLLASYMGIKTQDKIEENENKIKPVKKTKLCNSILLGIECKHGKMCRFRHDFSEEELKKTKIKKQVKPKSVSNRIVCKNKENCRYGSKCKFYHPERKEAYKTLSDSKKIQETKRYTKMCNSIVTGKKCRHGKNCRFAHSKDQLQISECYFKNSCRFVTKQNGVWVSTGKKVCQHIHPSETKGMYLTRLGIKL